VGLIELPTVRQGITQWIHKWKRNGWKNTKKGHITNATLWQELDSAVARMICVEFTWAKAHCVILINKCAGIQAEQANPI
jgi:ribonuclease HI